MYKTKRTWRVRESRHITTRQGGTTGVQKLDLAFARPPFWLKYTQI